jgi:hypothetical protein
MHFVCFPRASSLMRVGTQTHFPLPARPRRSSFRHQWSGSLLCKDRLFGEGQRNVYLELRSCSPLWRSTLFHCAERSALRRRRRHALSVSQKNPALAAMDSLYCTFDTSHTKTEAEVFVRESGVLWVKVLLP